jgi:hypothetical protein
LEEGGGSKKDGGGGQQEGEVVYSIYLLLKYFDAINICSIIEFDMHIMHEHICYKLYISISMFIVFVNLCMCACM